MAALPRHIGVVRFRPGAEALHSGVGRSRAAICSGDVVAGEPSESEGGERILVERGGADYEAGALAFYTMPANRAATPVGTTAHRYHRTPIASHLRNRTAIDGAACAVTVAAARVGPGRPLGRHRSRANLAKPVASHRGPRRRARRLLYTLSRLRTQPEQNHANK